MLKDGIRADAAIVGEALGPGAIGIAQKGLEWFRFDFEGRTVHGGQYQNGVNAIYKAVDFINAVRSRLEPELVKRELPLVGKSTVNIGVIQGGTQLSTVAGKCSVELDRRFLPGAETYEQCCGELEEACGNRPGFSLYHAHTGRKRDGAGICPCRIFYGR